MHALPLGNIPPCDVDPLHIASTVHLRTPRMREFLIVDKFSLSVCNLTKMANQLYEISYRIRGLLILLTVSITGQQPRATAIDDGDGNGRQD